MSLKKKVESEERRRVQTTRSNQHAVYRNNDKSKDQANNQRGRNSHEHLLEGWSVGELTTGMITMYTVANRTHPRDVTILPARTTGE